MGRLTHEPWIRRFLATFLFVLLLGPLFGATPLLADGHSTDAATQEGGWPVPPLQARLIPPLAIQEAAKAEARAVRVRGLMPSPDVESSPAVAAARAAGLKWIEVDLGAQKVYAYEGRRLVRSFVVSTGLPGTPTVTGEFRIWVRTPLQDMSGGSRAAGDYYYLEDVPWVQYFYQDYSFHGTYWHNNFGRPMSRGCVNMTIEDAKWLFDWAFPEWDGSGGWFRPTEENATLVLVHE